MKNKEGKNKHNYIKPEINEINLDHTISLWMMSEGSIPNPPPFGIMNEKTHYDNPFKAEKV